jgi:hypothetical protein
MISRHTSWLSASRLSTALLSRPHHNADSFESESLRSGECIGRLAWRPSRNCREPAQPRSCQARSPARGRSEAEWLDRAEERRTITRRDGRTARDRCARCGTRTANGARWWKRGRRRRSSATAVRIQSECALTLQNAGSRRNLTGPLIETKRTESATSEASSDGGSGAFTFRADGQRNPTTGQATGRLRGSWSSADG